MKKSLPTTRGANYRDSDLHNLVHLIKQSLRCI